MRITTFILTNLRLYFFDKQFGAIANVDMIPCDISVAGRVLAAFPEYLKPEQQVADNLSFLGEMCKTVRTAQIHFVLNFISFFHASIPSYFNLFLLR